MPHEPEGEKKKYEEERITYNEIFWHFLIIIYTVAQDLATILWWWVTLLLVGIAGWPWSKKIFRGWPDRGYLMAKALGLAIVTYVIWIGGTIGVFPFIQASTWLVVLGVWYLGRRVSRGEKGISWKMIFWEEGVFLAALILWSWVKAHEPTINGLEKFMDYGFTRSILQGKYFPPLDMWFAGKPINYYYFGHLMMAALTRLSGMSLGYTFNLMLATIFAMCLTQSYAIGRQLLNKLPIAWAIGGALLIAYLVTLAGNLHTIYAFTSGYAGREDNPPPFWDLEFTSEVGKNYWYPNATRFIPWTIHEFPSYSFVVSDVHGHVLSIPLALLAIALLVNMFGRLREEINWKEYGLYGWISGLMFMTNALDGIIYAGLFAVLLIARNLQFSISNSQLISKFLNFQFFKPLIVVGMVFAVTISPFVARFEPFVSGVAVNCPPEQLANSKIGPIIFEGAEKCQKSPLWMMLVLWGFFVYCGWWYIAGAREKELSVESKLLGAFLVFSLLLITFPEFFYFKDIYPLHFRSNTMFKLGYQAFMLSGIASGYAITYELWRKKRVVWLTGAVILALLVMIYPKFAVNSYFGNLKTYQSIWGLGWLSSRYPDDAQAIEWLEKTLPVGEQPVVLEANGDSYTDFNRISAFSGLPTVAGWTVHEWLWRGGYEPIALRAEEVKRVYESIDIEETKLLLNKYDVRYIVVGSMERQKYPQLDEEKIKKLGSTVFTTNTLVIYQVI
ncbi:MAG TPA: DUF2298 domain-containing protein [Patescibacteria group bacterium]|nr:DUF2298 domain-containing protein [Patescibacteria group bacterium]